MTHPFPDRVCVYSRILGVVLILVDFVLVIVDLALPLRSREVGNAIEAVSLVISFFFLADVLLRVYVAGWVTAVWVLLVCQVSHDTDKSKCLFFAIPVQ